MGMGWTLKDAEARRVNVRNQRPLTMSRNIKILLPRDQGPHNQILMSAGRYQPVYFGEVKDGFRFTHSVFHP